MKDEAGGRRAPSNEERTMSSSDESHALQTLVRERIDRWHERGKPDAAAVLTEHPELRGAKSLVMDLVLAEYSLRTAAGDALRRGGSCSWVSPAPDDLGEMAVGNHFFCHSPAAPAGEVD